MAIQTARARPRYMHEFMPGRRIHIREHRDAAILQKIPSDHAIIVMSSPLFQQQRQFFQKTSISGGRGSTYTYTPRGQSLHINANLTSNNGRSARIRGKHNMSASERNRRASANQRRWGPATASVNGGKEKSADNMLRGASLPLLSLLSVGVFMRGNEEPATSRWP